MEHLADSFRYVGLAILSFLWIYIAVRMAGRAIIRTMNEYRGRSNERKEGEHE